MAGWTVPFASRCRSALVVAIAVRTERSPRLAYCPRWQRGEMNRRFFHLQEFFLCYFHEDWNLDATTTAEVIHEYLACEDEAKIAVVLAELDELLRTMSRRIDSDPGCSASTRSATTRKADGSRCGAGDSRCETRWLPPPHDAVRQ